MKAIDSAKCGLFFGNPLIKSLIACQQEKCPFLTTVSIMTLTQFQNYCETYKKERKTKTNKKATIKYFTLYR